MFLRGSRERWRVGRGTRNVAPKEIIFRFKAAKHRSQKRKCTSHACCGSIQITKETRYQDQKKGYGSLAIGHGKDLIIVLLSCILLFIYIYCCILFNYCIFALIMMMLLCMNIYKEDSKGLVQWKRLLLGYVCICYRRCLFIIAVIVISNSRD